MALQTTLIILTLATSVLGLVGLFFRMGSSYGSLRADLRSLRAETVMGLDQVDRRFDEVNRRFDGVDQRFDRVDAGLVRLEDRVERFEDRVGGVAVDVARIGQKLDVHVLDPRGHQSV